MAKTKTDAMGNPFDPGNVDARRVPGLLTFLHPFRLVLPAEGTWQVTIEEVNKRSWDYVKLHNIVGGVDVGLPEPYHMIIGFDGSLVLPPCSETTPVEKAIEHFNSALAAVLLGGIYCEAIVLADVARSLILDLKYIRLHMMLEPHRASSSMTFHDSARTLRTPPDQATSLINPQIVSCYDFYQAHQTGRKILKQVPELSPDLLLKGVSAIAHREWSAVMTNLSIINEQITSILWTRYILQADGQPDIKGRIDQLKDTRAWSAATRQEALFQQGVINDKTLSKLFISRQARNRLVHRGLPPTEDEARASYLAFQGLLGKASTTPSPLFSMSLDKYGLIGPYDRRVEPAEGFEPTHWLPIPQLPHEAEINRMFYKDAAGTEMLGQ